MRRGHRPLRIGLIAALIGVLATAGPTSATSAKIVRHGDRSVKHIALTFDDGWSPRRTTRIVEILDAYGVTATFFPYGRAVEEYPELWRSIAQRFPVGNHTHNHVRVKGLPSWRIQGEITGAQRAFERVTGQQMVRLFRPPFGAYDESVAQAAYRLGYHQLVLWDVDSRDWKRPGDDVVLRRARSGTAGSIILLHADRQTTVRVLPAIIEYYKRRGYRFVSLPHMLGIDWSAGTPAGTGRPASWQLLQINRTMPYRS